MPRPPSQSSAAARWRSPSRNDQRGIALVMTLFVLAMLLAITLPFVLQSSQHEASAIAYRRRVQARMGAMSALDHAVSQMRQTNRLKQHARRIDAERSSRTPEFSAFYDERYDPGSEFVIDLANEFPQDFGSFDTHDSFDPNGSFRTFHLASDRQQLWSAQVTDEQGRINLNTAPPALIGNLIGSTIVRKVEGNLPSLVLICDDDAETFSEGPGYFVANGVLCSYLRRRGSRFEGVNISVAYNKDFLALDAGQRARSQTRYLPLFRELTKPQATSIPEGTLLIPLVAHLVAYNRLLRASGRQPGVYDNVDQMREVAELAVLSDSTHADAFTGARWMAAREFFTVASTGPSANGYFFPQVVTSIFRVDEELPHRGLSLSRADAVYPEWLEDDDPRRRGRGIPFGSTIRIEYDRQEPVHALYYGQLLAPQIIPGGQEVDAGRRHAAMVEVLERTPININTAPWEVLVANLKGLRAGNEVIGRSEAEAVVRGIIRVRGNRLPSRRKGYERLDREINARPDSQKPNALVLGGIRNDDQLAQILALLVEGKAIEGWVAQAIIVHQRSPNASLALSLAPFTYASYGAIRVDGIATTFTRSGMDTARSHIREFVSIGSDEPETWSWRPIDIMRANAQTPRGNIITLRRTPPVRELRHASVVAELPWVLDRAALGPTAGAQVWQTNDLSFLRPPLFDANANHRVNMRDGSEGTTEATDLRPGSIAFWYQVPQGPLDDAIIFDSGFSETESRITLLWWQPPRSGRLQTGLPGLALRLTDRAMESAYTVAYMKPSGNLFAPGQWYHIRCTWQGLDLSELSLTVDGLANMGETSLTPMRVDHVADTGTGVFTVRSSTLQTDIDPLLGSSTIDEILIDRMDVAGFPPSGVVYVGSEAIEYRSLTATGFQGLTRGARGTARSATPILAGSRVGQFGYTVPIESVAEAPYAIAGGGKLASTLHVRTDFATAANPSGRADALVYLPQDLNYESGIPRGNPLVTLMPANALPEAGVLYVRGPAWKTWSINPFWKMLVPDPTNEANSPSAVDDTGTVILPQVQEAWLLFRKEGGKVRILGQFTEGANGTLVALADDDQWHFLGPTSSGLVSASGYEVRGSVLILCSLHISDEGAYFDPQTLPNANRVRVQLDQEWVTYTTIIGGVHRLFAYIDTGTVGNHATAVTNALNASMPLPIHPMRSPGDDPLTGQTLTTVQSHALGIDVVPLFALGNEVGRRPGILRSGRDDLITLGIEVASAAGVLPNVSKQQRRVVRVENRISINSGQRVSGTQIVGLDASLRRDYPARTGYAIKFPSAELPRGLPARFRFGGALVRDIASKDSSGAVVDELVARSRNVEALRLLGGSSDAQTTLDINSQGQNLPAGTGMIKIDDEYIVYSRREVLANGGAFRLHNCVRGVLGSRPAAHAPGTAILNLDDVPVFTLTTPAEANQNLLELQGGLMPLAAPSFLRIERGNAAPRREMEIAGVNSIFGGTGTTRAIAGLVRPQEGSFDRALFRGVYGTTARSWPVNAVAVAFEVREPDFTPRWLLDEYEVTDGAVFSPEIAHLSGSESFAPARLQALRWSIDDFGNPRARANMTARLLVRLNDSGPWLERSGGVIGQTFDFGQARLKDDSGVGRSEMTFDLSDASEGRLVSRVEWVLLIGFRSGAYERDGWKQTLRIRGVELDLESETRVIRHEELDG